MNAVACVILTWLLFELCYDYVWEHKQIFHWCLFKKMFSGKCLFLIQKVLVYGGGRNSNVNFFHSAFFFWDGEGMLTAVSTTFYCLTFLSCHAPLQFLLLGVPIFSVLIYFLIYFLIRSVKVALGLPLPQYFCGYPLKIPSQSWWDRIVLFTRSDRNILVPLAFLEVGEGCLIFDSLKLVQYCGYLNHKIHQLHMSRKCSAGSSASAGMDAFRVSGV